MLKQVSSMTVGDCLPSLKISDSLSTNSKETVMERVFVLLKRKPGLSFEQFRSHYESSHAKLGEKYFGHLFASYRRNYVPSGLRLGDGTMVEPAYDCVTELIFREVGGYAELLRIAGEPEIQRILAEDEERFLDRMACVMAVSEPVESDLSQLQNN
jgi:hypothetical protein